MCRRIIDTLANLFGLLTGRGTRSIEARLDNIEKRLERMEEKLERQSRSASIVSICGLGLGLIAIGIAIRPESGAGGLSLMLFGLFLLVVASIFGLFYMRR